MKKTTLTITFITAAISNAITIALLLMTVSGTPLIISTGATILTSILYFIIKMEHKNRMIDTREKEIENLYTFLKECNGMKIKVTPYLRNKEVRNKLILPKDGILYAEGCILRNSKIYTHKDDRAIILNTQVINKY